MQACETTFKEGHVAPHHSSPWFHEPPRLLPKHVPANELVCILPPRSITTLLSHLFTSAHDKLPQNPSGRKQKGVPGVCLAWLTMYGVVLYDMLDERRMNLIFTLTRGAERPFCCWTLLNHKMCGIHAHANIEGMCVRMRVEVTRIVQFEQRWKAVIGLIDDS